MKSIQDCFTLNNGIEIPCMGYGTLFIKEEEAGEIVKLALDKGYRHIDTATVYKNERGVGEAIQASDLKREDIFVTSKIWNTEQGYESCKKAFAVTMEDLKLDYLDLYLIHWPVANDFRDHWETSIQETWKAIEELYEAGKIRAIGVSNFKPHHFTPLLETAKIKPMVNQIQLHPGFNQAESVAFCKTNDILVEAWEPLAQGKLFSVDVLAKMAEKYNKSIAQICLRWELQNGILPLPKSINPNHMVENTQIFDFVLEDEDIEFIDNITENASPVLDPDNVGF